MKKTNNNKKESKKGKTNFKEIDKFKMSEVTASRRRGRLSPKPSE